ncbi:MAG TPA: hypothetical protein PKA05_08610 [Roseiflexaceae bacterium]|nr:hypothetical protein [Roseiflexaceae bacterium]HMP40427.1 hypothetical protein [Roseiflexaceae bacterium]
MAVNVRQLFPLQQVRARRIDVSRYLKLDGGRYLIAAALMLSLMSLLTLGQTGRLATQGYEITALEAQKTVLLRERNGMLLRLAQAQAFDKIQPRATELGLRPAQLEQVRYVSLETVPDTTAIQIAAP